MDKSGGTIANNTGDAQEAFIENRLVREGYLFIDKHKFIGASKSLNQPVYTKQIYVADSLYGTSLKTDFLIFHQSKHSECLSIESKWQQSKGSVDEKYPFLVLNIKTKYPYKAIIILDGKGYKKKAMEWLKSKIGGNLLAVFDMSEFQKWVNKGGL